MSMRNRINRTAGAGVRPPSLEYSTLATLQPPGMPKPRSALKRYPVILSPGQSVAQHTCAPSSHVSRRWRESDQAFLPRQQTLGYGRILPIKTPVFGVQCANGTPGLVRVIMPAEFASVVLSPTIRGVRLENEEPIVNLARWFRRLLPPLFVAECARLTI